MSTGNGRGDAVDTNVLLVPAGFVELQKIQEGLRWIAGQVRIDQFLDDPVVGRSGRTVGVVAAGKAANIAIAGGGNVIQLVDNGQNFLLEGEPEKAGGEIG
jgi:hypothetical protein